MTKWTIILFAKNNEEPWILNSTFRPLMESGSLFIASIRLAAIIWWSFFAAKLTIGTDNLKRHTSHAWPCDHARLSRHYFTTASPSLLLQLDLIAAANKLPFIIMPQYDLIAAVNKQPFTIVAETSQHRSCKWLPFIIFVAVRLNCSCDWMLFIFFAASILICSCRQLLFIAFAPMAHSELSACRWLPARAFAAVSWITRAMALSCGPLSLW